MTKTNIEFNSPNLERVKHDVSNKNPYYGGGDDAYQENFLKKYFPIFEKSKFFTKDVIEKGSVLFNEGDIDNYLYIIRKGFLSVEKYTTIDRITTKQLAILKDGDFFGEASMSLTTLPKESMVKVLRTTEIYKIDASKDLRLFLGENPDIGYDFLRYIIYVTNKRLSESNAILTSSEEIANTIHSIREVNHRSIFALIDKMRLIGEVDYVLYFEKHQVLPNCLTLRYDSRYPNKMQEKIFEKSGYFLNLDHLLKQCDIKDKENININKISIGDETYGYLLFCRKEHPFQEKEKKVFLNISNSLAGVVKRYFSDTELKDKLYIEEMKK